MKYQVWSCGGGTQSCAIGALIVQEKLPKPDIAVMADTEKEMPSTWEYMNAVLRPALAAAGVDLRVISKSEWAYPWGREIIATTGKLMLPAYTNKSGKAAKLSAFCSSSWKQEVVDRWLSYTCKITRKNYVKWIGFSTDESRRVNRTRRGEEFQRGLIRLPLIDDVPTDRSGAIEIVQSMGWPKPPRSRCWMCPNQSDAEWVEVRDLYPELFAEAVEMDEEIRTRDPHAFLHSSVGPLRDAQLDPRDEVFSAGCPDGECYL